MKLSTFVAALSWTSLFALIWLCLIGSIEATPGVIVIGIIFFFIALGASLSSYEKPVKKLPPTG